MSTLSVVFLVLSFWHDAAPRAVPVDSLYILGALFLLEFAGRLWDSPSRTEYLQGHWIDIVACLPFIGGLRALRIVRLVRLAPALRLRRCFGIWGDTMGRDGFWFLGPTVTVLCLVSATVMWTLEQDKNPHMHTFGEALYWSFITMTTVGNSPVKPVTTEGQIVGGLLIFVGIGLLGFVSSRLTALWLHQGGGGATSAELMRQIEEMHAQLKRVESLLEQQGRVGSDVKAGSTSAAAASPSREGTPLRMGAD